MSSTIGWIRPHETQRRPLRSASSPPRHLGQRRIRRSAARGASARRRGHAPESHDGGGRRVRGHVPTTAAGSRRGSSSERADGRVGETLSRRGERPGAPADRDEPALGLPADHRGEECGEVVRTRRVLDQHERRVGRGRAGRVQRVAYGRAHAQLVRGEAQGPQVRGQRGAERWIVAWAEDRGSGRATKERFDRHSHSQRCGIRAMPISRPGPAMTRNVMPFSR